MLVFERYMRVSESINHCVVHFLLVKEKETVVMERFERLNMSRKYEFEDVRNQMKK